MLGSHHGNAGHISGYYPIWEYMKITIRLTQNLRVRKYFRKCKRIIKLQVFYMTGLEQVNLCVSSYCVNF